MISTELRQVYDQRSSSWCPEARAFSLLLLQSLQQLEQRVKQLEDQQATHSGNSSIPPSKNPLASPAKRSLRKKGALPVGGQLGHPGSGGRLVDDPDEVVRYQVETCPDCNASLSEVPPLEVKKKQVVDLPPIKPSVTEHQLEVKRCPGCGWQGQARDCTAVFHQHEYGVRIKSLAVYLSTYQMIPQKRIQSFLALFGIELSTGTLNNFRRAAAGELTDWWSRALTYLKQAPKAHFDETGIKVDGRGHWIHSAGDERVVLYQLDKKRGRQAHQRMGILPDFRGVAHHDSYAPYDYYTECTHSLCNAHFLRELTFAIDRNQQACWAEPLIKLLLHIKSIVEAKVEGKLCPTWRGRFRNQYLKLVEQGLKNNPAQQHRAAGQSRGRIKQTKTHNLLLRLRDRVDDVLRYMADPNAVFDNNLAERDLRMNKVRAKVSGGFRSLKPAQEFMRVRSLIATAVKQEYCPLETLQSLFSPLDQQYLLLANPAG